MHTIFCVFSLGSYRSDGRLSGEGRPHLVGTYHTMLTHMCLFLGSTFTTPVASNVGFGVAVLDGGFKNGDGSKTISSFVTVASLDVSSSVSVVVTAVVAVAFAVMSV